MQSPFKFLEAYTKADRDIFFGRDREIEEMYQKVFESKILLIYGISGTGKTSLINCGLANKFEDSDWLPVNVRRGVNITDSLWNELRKVAITPVVEEKEKGRDGGTKGKREGEKGHEGEWEKGGGDKQTSKSPPLQGGDLEGSEIFSQALQSIYLDHFKPIYLIFDQFEELFIFGSREEREEFIKVVKEIVDSDVQCKFIFSIREEYLAGVTEFEITIPDFLSNRMRIEKMTRQHAIEVIEGPCEVHGINVEEGFPEALLDKLNPEGKEVELTYLQVFLDKVYKLAQDKGKYPPLQGGDLEGGEVAPGDTEEGEMASGDTERGEVSSSKGTSPLRMTLSLLDKIGDVTDLLGSFLEEQIGQLEDPDTGLMILKAFVSVKGTKRQITEEEMIDFSRTFGKPIENERLTKLIQRFVNLRILRDKDENGRYELRHDSLAATIYEKITIVEKELIEIRQFIENAYENYKRRGILLAPDDLDYLKVYRGKLFISKELEDFIEKSISAVEAKVRTLKRITSFSIIALLLIVSLIGYYYFKKQDKSRAIDFSVQALLQKNVTPQLSFQSAYQAYLIDSVNTISKKAVFDAFYSMIESGPYYDSTGQEVSPDKDLFNFEAVGSEIISASFSEDDKFITGFLENNSVFVWNKKGREIISFDFDHPVFAVKLSGNHQYLGVLCSDSIVYMYDLKGEEILDMKVSYHILHPDDVFQLSSDGKIMIHINPQNEIIFTEIPSGKTRQTIPRGESDINDIAISDDQHWLVAGLKDGTIQIWNKSNGQGYSFFRTIPAHDGSVWSVEFSKNSLYILSASEDSSYCIWDLYGWKTYGPSDEGYPYLNRDPYCKALFRGKDMGMILTAYNKLEEEINVHDENILNPDIPFIYYTRLDFSFSSPVNYSDVSPYIGKPEDDLYERIINNQPGNRLTCFDYSPNGFYYALTNLDNHTTGLYYADGLNLKILQGSKPVFSNDGKYLICIENDMLRLYVAEVSEMIRLVLEENIFSPVNSNIAE